MAATPRLRVIGGEEVRSWIGSGTSLSDLVRSIGQKAPHPDYVENELGIPLHLQRVIEELNEEHSGAVPKGALDSIPFHSLCRGLFLPLSCLTPDRAGALFGFQSVDPPDTTQREALLKDFLAKPLGLSLPQKLGCILGDPFLGKPSTFRRDSMVRLLMSVQMRGRREMLDRLTVVGDVSVMFAESRPRLREEPPLTAAEVLETLRLIPKLKRTERFDVLRSLLERSGKLEAYFLSKLLLRKAGFGFDYQGPLIARILAEQYKVEEGLVSHAIGLTDVFHVARALVEDGPDALHRIQLQPLVPVRPALASGTVDEAKKFPVWVERKYDGIRLMLHKSTDSRGSVLCGAYTRNRHDWLELAPGLDASIRMMPARDCIVDGELYGTVLDFEGARPASVYEVYAQMQGEKGGVPVTLKYAAFDLVYLNGRDLTKLPLSGRRQQLASLLGPLAAMPLPLAVSMSEGQLAQNKDDVSRLYGHFRSQGYEGVIAKDPDGPYMLGSRDPSWLKRKPEITLDVVLLGAVLAVTEKTNAGRFGSYVIGIRAPDGGWQDIGDVAGLDRERDLQIQHEIMREGLITGRRIERPSASGARPGFELRPDIVVTVRFEGIARENVGGKLSLRDPKVVVIRSDKQPHEADTVKSLEEIYLRQRVG